MKTIATLTAAIALSIGLAGTASATSPNAEIGPKASIAPAACYYQYQWFNFGGQTGYTRQLVCF